MYSELTLKMMVKSGLDFFLKNLHAQFFLLQENAQNCKFSNKNDIFCAW